MFGACFVVHYLVLYLIIFTFISLGKRDLVALI